MKILNLYAGIGGNRKLWGDEHDITAVENNEKIANIYKDLYPNDEVIVEDAHQYLLDHHKQYDFIWSSPPCQSHSRTNIFLNAQGRGIRYPDMNLWQEILYLKRFHKGKFVVENVRTYYEPLIKPVEMSRHFFWLNFSVNQYKIKPKFSTLNCKSDSRKDRKTYYKELQDYLGIYLKKDLYINHDKFSVLTNCVHPLLGQYILDCAMNVRRQENVKQTELF